MKTPKKRREKAEKPLDKAKTRKFTCLVCPTCCELETDGSNVNGALCPRGEAFALQEVVMPMRVITTTVPCETADGRRMVPVKTTGPVPLASIFEIMKEIKALHLREIPEIGTTLRTNSAENPVELVVTGEVE